MKPTVFLVDDDRSFLRSTKRLFESEGMPVAAFSSGEEFFENYKTGHPGCLLLDLKMRAMSGLEVIGMMRELDVMLPTIVMTAFGNVQAAVQAMKLGALDFVEKPIHNNPGLLKLVRRTLAVERVSPKNFQEVEETRDRLRPLTDREREILFRVADGLSSSEIASEFDLSLATVNSHRINIMKKLEVGSVKDLISLVSRYRIARESPAGTSKAAPKKRR